MADNSVLTEAGQFEQQFKRMAAMIRCALPGVISGFDPATQRASVVPGIKMKVTQGAEVSYLNLPEIPNVPVVTPYGFAGQVLLTHPIKKGDPCLLVFSDRAMDNFLQTGQSENPISIQGQETTAPRAHHLSDAICIPGLIADPQVVPEWNQENIELRDFDRKVYFSLGPEGIMMTDGIATMEMKGGVITEKATSASRVTEGVNTLVGSNVAIGKDGNGASINEIQGSLKSRNGTFIDANGRDSSAHIHSGVQTGGGNTGPTSG